MFLDKLRNTSTRRQHVMIVSSLTNCGMMNNKSVRSYSTSAFYNELPSYFNDRI